jgi:hypothetical protein
MKYTFHIALLEENVGPVTVEDTFGRTFGIYG